MEDINAAIAEYEGLSQGEQPQNEAQQVSDEPMYEIPYGDQVYKLPLSHELPIKHNGQVIKAPLEKVLNAFRERQHLSDKFSAFNKEREEFEAAKAALGDMNQLSELQKIQQWSQESPEEFERFWEMYQNRDNYLKQGDESGMITAELQSLRSTIKQQQDAIQQLMSGHEEQQTAAEIQEVEQEIDAFKSQYGEKYGIKLEETDEEGLSLQARIIKHGIDNNIDSFKLAAFDFLEDRLFTTAQQEGRREVADKIKQDRRAGIIGRSATPTTGETNLDPLKMNEDELMNSALSEFNKLVSQTS